MQKWEYLFLPIRRAGGWLTGGRWEIRIGDKTYKGDEAVVDFLNEAGQNGWELLSVAPLNKSGTIEILHLWFKRPIPETDVDA